MVAAGIAGAIGDEAMNHLVARAQAGFRQLADPARLPDNHHYLRVLRTARLNALRRLALETQDELNIARERSPFLRDLTAWLDEEDKRDIDKALDPRVLEPASDVKPPAEGDISAMVRAMAYAAQAVRGLFEAEGEPVPAQHFFSASERVALENMEIFFLSDTRMQTGVAAGDDVAMRMAKDHAALRAGLVATCFGEMVIAVKAEDINWAVEAPADFNRRFHDETKGYFATLKTEIDAALVEDLPFREKYQALMSAQQARSMRALHEKVDEIRNTERGLNVQVEGVLREILRAGLPDDAFEAAFYGGREELAALRARLGQASNTASPGENDIRQRAKALIEEGRLGEADSALRELRAHQRDARRSASAEEARTEADLAGLARSRGRLMDAADHYAAAAELVKDSDRLAMASYRFAEGNAIGDFGCWLPGMATSSREVAAFQTALAVWSEADTPDQWAKAQGNLGVALSRLGEFQGGEAGADALSRAIEALEAALRIHTLEGAPVEWAGLQNNLGNALKIYGEIRGGKACEVALAKAVQAFELSLQVHKKTKMPIQWAMTQTNLGNALKCLSERLSGQASVQALARAVAAYEAALEVQTPSGTPAEWVGVQNNLGNALRMLGERQGGEAGARALNRSAAAFEAALKNVTETEMPALWAITQSNLGVTLKSLGRRQSEEESIRTLMDAVSAFEAVLRIYSETETPRQWAMTQNNLGATLKCLGQRLGDEAGLHALSRAVDAFNAALRVITQCDMPADWAGVQNNLGNALRSLGERIDGEARARVLSQAVEALVAAQRAKYEAGEIVEWAGGQQNLGAALTTLGIAQGGEAGARTLLQAVVAYEAALRVYTETEMPARWAMTQENMGLCREAMAAFDEFDAASQLKLAIAAFENSLRVYTAEHMPYDYGTATQSLARVRARLAALEDPA